MQSSATPPASSGDLRQTRESLKARFAALEHELESHLRESESMVSKALTAKLDATTGDGGGHRKLAVAVILLLGCALSYSFYTLITDIRGQRADPPVSVKGENAIGRVSFPWISVCANQFAYAKPSWFGSVYSELARFDLDGDETFTHVESSIRNDSGFFDDNFDSRPCLNFASGSHKMMSGGGNDWMNLAFSFTLSLEQFCTKHDRSGGCIKYEYRYMPSELEVNIRSGNPEKNDDADLDYVYTSYVDYQNYQHIFSLYPARYTHLFEADTKKLIYTVGSTQLIPLMNIGRNGTAGSDFGDGVYYVDIYMEFPSDEEIKYSEVDPVDPWAVFGAVSGFFGSVATAWAFVFVDEEDEEGLARKKINPLIERFFAKMSLGWRPTHQPRTAGVPVEADSEAGVPPCCELPLVHEEKKGERRGKEERDLESEKQVGIIAINPPLDLPQEVTDPVNDDPASKGCLPALPC